MRKLSKQESRLLMSGGSSYGGGPTQTYGGSGGGSSLGGGSVQTYGTSAPMQPYKIEGNVEGQHINRSPTRVD